MKKFVPHIVSFVLLAMSFFVIQKIEAQHSQVTLQMSAGNIDCDYTTWYDFGSLAAADVFAHPQTMTGSLGSFVCQDLKWTRNWVLTVHTYNLTTPLGHIISDISVKADPNQVTTWVCSTGTNTYNRTDINVNNWSSAQSIIVKDSVEWDICIIQAQNVLVKIEVPQAQPIWEYVAEFVVMYPA